MNLTLNLRSCALACFVLLLMQGCSIQYADPYYGYLDEEKTFKSEGLIATMNQGGPFVRHPKKPERWKDLPSYQPTKCLQQPVVNTRELKALQSQINKKIPDLKSHWHGGQQQNENTLLRLEIPQKSLFYVDAPHLKPDAYTTLDQLSLIINNANVRVDFVGHTDTTGPAAYNQTLSGRRALHLQRYFVLKGLPKAHSNSYGLGETSPLASNATQTGRKMNRRVSLIFCSIEA